MTIVVEDGSIVSGANSYATLAQIRSYASARGVTVSADDATLEVSVAKSMQYLLSKEQSFLGQRVSSDQELSFPRQDLYLYGFLVPETAIPQTIIDAQCRLVMYVEAGADPFGTTYDGTAPLKRKKIDVIEKEYDTFLQSKFSSSSTTPEVDRLLEPLMRAGGSFRSVRV